MGRYKEHSVGFGGAGSHITIFGMPDYAGDIDNLIASGRTAGKVKACGEIIEVSPRFF